LRLSRFRRAVPYMRLQLWRHVEVRFIGDDHRFLAAGRSLAAMEAVDGTIAPPRCRNVRVRPAALRGATPTADHRSGCSRHCRRCSRLAFFPARQRMNIEAPSLSEWQMTTDASSRGRWRRSAARPWSRTAGLLISRSSEPTPARRLLHAAAPNPALSIADSSRHAVGSEATNPNSSASSRGTARSAIASHRRRASRPVRRRPGPDHAHGHGVATEAESIADPQVSPVPQRYRPADVRRHCRPQPARRP
jgi:hypothetical protein